MSLSKLFPSRILVAISIATLITAIPTSSRAQVVRGTVVDQASGRPLPATVVVLLDSAGKRLAGVLSGEDGRYALRITTPGRYGVRAERIGFRAEAPTPISIAVGQTVELRLETRPIPVVLGAVQVTGRTTCVARASDGAGVSAVWDEARKALFATDLTQRQELFSVKLTRFERMLDPQTRRVLSHETRQTTGVTRNPFVSRPAAQLSEDGFVRQVASEVIYYGPDAAVLLSDEFLGDHCFRLRNGSGRRSAMIGLTFEPVRGREKPDIAGTLWLDQKTAELRDLEYVYVNLQNMPADMRSDDFGGRIEFHRMPTGAWIVERWVIRMPVLVDRGPFARQDATVPGTASREQRVQIAAIKEEGGEVTESMAQGAQRTLVSEVGSVRGTVHDSTRMLGLSDARVFLDGTQYTSRSSVGGTFSITNVPPGTYTLSVTHPRFDSLHTRAPSASVTVQGGEEAVASLAGPSVKTMIDRDCTAYERTNGGGMVRGSVTDSLTGAPAIDALVTVLWNRPEVVARRTAVVSERHAVTRTDSAGRYVICGLPSEVRLTVEAAAAGRRSAAKPLLLLASGDLAVHDLAIGTATVVASAGRPTPQAAAVSPTPINRAMRDFERRRRRGNGSFLTRAQIDKSNASRLTDLLRRMPSVTVLPSDNGSIMVELRGSKRVTFSGTTILSDTGSSTSRLPAPPQGTTSVSVDNCPAAFLLDGLAIDGGSSVDLEMRPGMLEGIEVYTPAQVPIEYASRFSECGVVMIWTRAFAERFESQSGADGER